MLNVIFNATTTLVIIFLGLHLISIMVMIYSASLTCPKGLPFKTIVNGFFFQALALYRLYWYKPWLLIIGGVKGILIVKKNGGRDGEMMRELDKMATTYSTIMQKLPDAVVERTVAGLNTDPVLGYDDNTVTSFEQLIVEMYRDSHPALKNLEKVCPLNAVELSIAKEIYGCALNTVIREANDELKMIQIHPAEIEHRILHVSLVLLGVVGEDEPFQRYLPTSHSMYILKDLNK